MGAQRLTGADVACWVLKTSAPPDAVALGWAPGGTARVGRCVRPSYRLGLMAPGQRCLLWLSGRQDPGVHAVGVLTSPPDDDLVVGVALHRLAEPLPRAHLLGTAFATAEVVRMPAGSNPSWLTAAQLFPVLDHLDAAELAAAGWA